MWLFFSCHSLFTFQRTVLLSFSVTGSQLSQCFAVRNWVVSLTKTKGRENSNLLYCEVFFWSLSSTGPPLQKLVWTFTCWINCSSDLKIFANFWPSAWIWKVFSITRTIFSHSMSEQNTTSFFRGVGMGKSFMTLHHLVASCYGSSRTKVI